MSNIAVAEQNPKASTQKSKEEDKLVSHRAEDFPLASLRELFPALKQKNEQGGALVYFDSAASALKPREVIDTIAEFYATDYANVHRSAHALAERATERYEGAREAVRQHLGAREVQEIVFTRNATEAINLVVNSWGDILAREFKRKPALAVTMMEHHSNLVPWQRLATRCDTKLLVMPITEAGEIDLEAYEHILQTNDIALVALAHISNVLGTKNPVAELIAIAHRHDTLVLVDGSQAVPHAPVDVRALDADFYVFTGHKVFAPSGIGVLYGKEKLLEAMPPWQYGGEMVERVSYQEASWNRLPWKFEAGTPPIAQAVGLGAALKFVQSIDKGMGIEAIAAYENRLGEFMRERLQAIEGLTLLGAARERAPIFSFALDKLNAFDLAALLDKQGFCCRAGFHCAEPLVRHYGLEGCLRVSLSLYNSEQECEAFVEALAKARAMLT